MTLCSSVIFAVTSFTIFSTSSVIVVRTLDVVWIEVAVFPVVTTVLLTGVDLTVVDIIVVSTVLSCVVVSRVLSCVVALTLLSLCIKLLFVKKMWHKVKLLPLFLAFLQIQINITCV